MPSAAPFLRVSGQRDTKPLTSCEPRGANGQAPLTVQGPMVWSGSSYSNPSSHTIHLDKHLDEIKKAHSAFRALEVDGDTVNKNTFLLPTLQPQLAEAAQEIHSGRGFVVLRGLDPAQFSAEDNVLLFLGLASHIGSKRGIQSAKGDMLVHVTDSPHWHAVPYDKRHGIHGNNDMPFHCDMGADIMALQIRQVAMNGGATHLASAWTVYNELAKTQRSVLETLCKPNWPIQVSGVDGRYILAPLIQYHDNKIMISLDPGRLGLHPSTVTTCGVPPPVPDLSPTQVEALRILNTVAAKHALQLDLQAGDLVFFNNWAILHARDSFNDEPTPDNRRHLVRLWLSNPELAWSVPASMRLPRDTAFSYLEHDTSGKAVWHRGRFIEPRYPILPERDYKVPKYTAGSAAFVLDDDETNDLETYLTQD